MDALRPYAPADRAACLAVFDACTPRFFAPGERPLFETWLDAPPKGVAYRVIERDGRVVAGGGWMRRGATATLCWAMVEPGLHCQGLGGRLVRARLETLRGTPGVRRVRLGTSFQTRGFYERFGFRVAGVTPDGYGPGLDRVDMTLRL